MKFSGYIACAGVLLSATTVANAQNNGSSEPPYAYTQSYFVGEWVDGTDCSVNKLVMRADGTLTAPNGGRTTWRLDGNRLTFGSGATATSFTVHPVSRNRVLTYNDDGSTGYSTRC